MSDSTKRTSDTEKQKQEKEEEQDTPTPLSMSRDSAGLGDGPPSAPAHRRESKDWESNVEMRQQRQQQKMLLVGVLQQLKKRKDAKDRSDDEVFFKRIFKVLFLALSRSNGGDGEEVLFLVRKDYKERPAEDPTWARARSQVFAILDDSGSVTSHAFQWEWSFYLNLILQHFQCNYTFAVAQAKPEAAARAIFSGAELLGTDGVDVILLRKNHVPVSSSFARFDQKATKTTHTFPKLYFSVDNFEEEFREARLLKDQWLALQLEASMSLPLGPMGKDKEYRHRVFSGKVKYKALKQAYFASMSPFASRSDKGQREFLMLKGPMGRTEVQLAMSLAEDARPRLDDLLGNGRPPSAVSSTFSSAASSLKKMWRAAAGSGAADMEDVALRPALTFVSVEWRHLVDDVLFQALEDLG